MRHARIGAPSAALAALLAVVMTALSFVNVPRAASIAVTTTANSSNSFAAASSFVRSLAYSAVGPPVTRTSSGPLTVSYPAGTAVNDLLLLVEVNSANQAITTPTGWNLIADAATSKPSQMRFTVWWRLAPSSGSSVALDVNTNSGGATAWVVRYTRPGGYPPNPVTAASVVSSGTSNPASSLQPSPDLTTNLPNATVISLVAVRDGNTLTLATPYSFVRRLTQVQSSVGQPVALAAADRVLPASGSTPTSPIWNQSGTAAQWAWATIAFA